MRWSRWAAWLVGLGLWGAALGSASGSASGSAQGSTHGAVACPSQPLRIAFSNLAVPPFLNGDGDDFVDPAPGLLVQEARRALAKVGCPATMVRLPQGRVELELASGRLDMAIAFGPTAERRAALRFPEGPEGVDARRAIGRSPVSLVVLAARQRELQAAWRAKALKGPVGALVHSVHYAAAVEQGLNVRPILRPSATLELLERRNVDAVALPTTAYAALLQERGGGLALLEPPLTELLYFAPVSKAFHRDHAPLVEALWRHLCDEARQRAVAPGCRPEGSRAIDNTN